MIHRPSFCLWVYLLGLLFGIALVSAWGQPARIELVAPAPAPVRQISASVNGTSGGATYFYWVVARYPAGSAVAGGPAQINRAPNTLNAANFVRVTWQQVPGATSYDVLRTGSTAAPLNGCLCLAASSAANFIDDAGGALAVYNFTAAAPAVSGTIALDNRDFSPPRLVFPAAVDVQIPGNSNLIAPSTANIIGVPGANKSLFYGNAGVLAAIPEAKYFPTFVNDGIIQVDTSDPASFGYGFEHRGASNGAVRLSTFIDTTGGWFGTKTVHPLKFFTSNGSQNLEITTSRQVLIGPSANNAGGDVTIQDGAGGGATEMFIRGGASQGTASPTVWQDNAGNVRARIDPDGMVYPREVTFANLPAGKSNGGFLYCSDCTKATPCAAAGTGSLAKRLNGAWDCN